MNNGGSEDEKQAVYDPGQHGGAADIDQLNHDAAPHSKLMIAVLSRGSSIRYRAEFIRPYKGDVLMARAISGLFACAGATADQNPGRIRAA